MVAADLATKRDLHDLEQRLTIRFGTMLVVAVGILLGGLAATTSIVLNRLPGSTPHGRAADLARGPDAALLPAAQYRAGSIGRGHIAFIANGAAGPPIRTASPRR